MERSERRQWEDDKWQSFRHGRQLAWLIGSKARLLLLWIVSLGAMHAFHYYPRLWTQDLLWLMVAEAWAVGNTTGHQYRKSEAVWKAYGAQQPERDQAWMRPKQSAQRYPLQSLLIS
jgi:Ni/Co efflux regulator RcnB